MADLNVAKIVGKVGFNIDSKSWANLGKFQKSLIQTKKMMQGLNANLKLNVSSVTKTQQKFQKASQRKTSLSSMLIPDPDAQNKELMEMRKYYSKIESEQIRQQQRIEAARIKQQVGSLTAKTGAERASSMGALIGREKGVLEQLNAGNRAFNQYNNLVDIASTRTERLNDITKRYAKNGKLATGFISNQQIKMNALNKELIQGGLSTRRYSERVRKLTQDTREAAKAHKGLFERISSVRGLMMSGAVLGGVGALNNIMRTGQELESLEAAMIRASGSLKEARKDMKWVTDQAYNLGLDLGFAADGFVKLAVAGKDSLGIEGVKDLFEGYSQFAVSVGTNQFRFEKGLTALGQIMNKGQLMAEEVKGQLAEQVVGSLQVFSDALGMTTKEFFKAMENGELLAEDVMPLVAKQFKLAANEGGALEQMLLTNRVKMGQLITTFKMWKNKVFTSGFKDGLNFFFDSLSLILKVTKPLASVLGVALRTAITGLVLPFRLVSAIVADLTHGFKQLMDMIGFDVDARFGNLIKNLLGVAAGVMVITKAVRALATLLGIKTAGKLVMANPALAAGAGAAAGVGFLMKSAIESAQGPSKEELEKRSKMGFFESLMQNVRDKGITDLGSLLPFISPFKTGAEGAKIIIEVKDSEFGKAVEARIEQKETDNVNRMKERFSN